MLNEGRKTKQEAITKDMKYGRESILREGTVEMWRKSENEIDIR